MRNVASSGPGQGACSELETLVQFRQGCAETREAAFEALFRLHQRSVHGWILRIVRNAPAAEDLTIETFWRIYRAYARFEPERRVEPWARRIATHAALDSLRAQKPEYATASEFFSDLRSPVGAHPAVSAEILCQTRPAPGLACPSPLAP